MPTSAGNVHFWCALRAWIDLRICKAGMRMCRVYRNSALLLDHSMQSTGGKAPAMEVTGGSQLQRTVMVMILFFLVSKHCSTGGLAH
jgi:hypothetical protein